ncbi:DNA-binding protein [Domibacillus antri]|uniref:DNA-binding protein n=1 Tax=Domibacillus antri TaxID=1714264 RepID=A0A1Q8Q8B2_9BACI|nr:cupin domain-containing protein [Domibacillus antri]OLN23578.1 DNA-binding protein [Domibacillus antri]
MDIGEKIRTIRQQKKMTIASMCDAAGLSKGFVSNIENGHTSPSIATLQQIANALDVPMAYFFLEKKDRMRVIRESERTKTVSGKMDGAIEHINFTGHLRMIQSELPPGGSTGDGHFHAGEEIHLVLKGKVLARQGDDEAILEAGDSFSWNAAIPHYVENIGDDTAVILMAITKSETKF